MFDNDRKGVQIEIQFGRKISSIFLVTYLPTILMNIINQATSFFDGTIFSGDIIKVNMTCMMVLSALYISVSNSLPTTSSIKYIEIWLIFSLMYPFFIVLAQTFIQKAKSERTNAISPQILVTPTATNGTSSMNKLRRVIAVWKKMRKEDVGIFIVKFIVPAFGISFICIYFGIGLYLVGYD